MFSVTGITPVPVFKEEPLYDWDIDDDPNADTNAEVEEIIESSEIDIKEEEISRHSPKQTFVMKEKMPNTEFIKCEETDESDPKEILKCEMLLPTENHQECEICGEIFTSDSETASILQLQKHIKEKHQSQKCQHCGMGFDLQVHLYRHLKTKHKGMN